MPGALAFPLALAVVAALQAESQAGDSVTPTRHAVAAHASAPSLRAGRLEGALTIDGRFDEPAWADAPPIERFIQTDPAEGQPATERTSVRVLISGDALYVGARMYDSEAGRVKAVLARRDDAVQADEFDLYLDTFHDHLSGVHFRITPGGAILDGILGSSMQGSDEDASWDPVWESATQVDSLGWTAELRIPLSQLRYNSSQNGVWGIQLYRKVLRKGEEDWFSFVPKSETGGVSRYGHLVNLGRLRAQRSLEVTPYALARATSEQVPAGDPFRAGQELHGSAGLDFSYGLTSDLTLNGTVNPDFGQVEVDPAVVNLSAFETFFPEKRPFFVEGADVFRFGGIRTSNSYDFPTFFFSRRIGRAPQRTVVGDSISFLDEPTETSIIAAAKLSGRTRSGWSLGALNAVTAGEQARFVDPGGSQVSTPVEPLSNYFVARVRKDLRQGNSTVGMIATAVNRDQAHPELESLLRGQAYLVGADFTNSWFNRAWSLDGAFGLSSVHGSPSAIALTQRSSARYYQRPDAKSFTYDPGRTSLTGYAYQVALSKNSGTHWLGGLVYQETGHAFEANDLGFQSNADRRAFSTSLAYQETKPGRIFRDYEIFPFTNHTWNFDGDRVFGSFGLILDSHLRNFSHVQVRGDYAPLTYDDRLTRGGPVAQQPANADVRVTLGSDSRKTTKLDLNFTHLWTTAEEHQTNLTLTLGVRPSPALHISVGPAFTDNRNLAQYVTTVPDPIAAATYGSRYVFGTLDQTEVSMETRVDWTFTPALTLQLYLQPLVSAGDFSDLKELSAPRTYDFAVYGKDKGTATEVPGGTEIDPGDGGATFTVPPQDFTIRSFRANAVLRWEWRPGSTLYLVWQQNRDNNARFGTIQLGRDFDALFSGGEARNVLAVKASYWLNW